MKKSIYAGLITLALCLGLLSPAGAQAPTTLEASLSGSAAQMLHSVKAPAPGSIGGEWAVLGLARSGYNVPASYYQRYYAALEKAVIAGKGVLHDKKYTEYSRSIVALSALGKDARTVCGYDLTLPLGDYDKTIWQGINGPIWALIALDSANYPVPKNPAAKTQATRELYLQHVLDAQLPDGGWSLQGAAGSVSDPDLTGMALQALAKYQENPAVKTATDKALSCLSKQQDENGGYSSWTTNNSESVVQVLVALCELGIPLDDARFVKNGHTVLDNLLSFRQADGSFVHTGASGGSNQMASEQGLYGLAAAQRAATGKNSLYRMSDANKLSDAPTTTPGTGLATKHKDIAVPPLGAAQQFTDLGKDQGQTAVLALAQRGILGGKGAGLFDPSAPMTRAEFSTCVVRALGLPVQESTQFADVPAGQWFSSFVGTAQRYGIVTGLSETSFAPHNSITRQEAAVMVARAAKLCGLETTLDEITQRDMLAQFGDYTKCATWARPALAFCYQENILKQQDLDIRPLDAILRYEVSEMLYALLNSAKLL